MVSWVSAAWLWLAFVGPAADERGGPDAPVDSTQRRSPNPDGPKPDPAPPGVQLVWDAPRQCASPEDMQARLDDAMGLSDPSARDRWAIARVRQDEGRWTLRIWTAPGEALSERALQDDSCEALERAAVTIVAMLLPATVAPAADLDPLGEAPPPPVVVFDDSALAELIADIEDAPPAPTDDRVPTMEPPPDPPLHGSLGFAGTVGSNALPRRSGGVAVTPALVWPHARLELRAAYAGSRSVGIDFAPEARARFSLLTAAVRGCGVPVEKRLEFPLCGGIEAGSLLAIVDGFRLLHGPGQPWVSVQVSGGMTFRATEHVALTAVAETWAALLRAHHRALAGDVAKSGRVGIRGLFGIEFRFGTRRRRRTSS